ncbi:DUF2254 domain-containing protein [Roseovarius sp. LXJ103]|nr:DUF2254 domain-containing protein [Roseovarius carneus]PWE37222.1 DUF2254 domain-containing protein [Pelagicola sp. LXJ1103]
MGLLSLISLGLTQLIQIFVPDEMAAQMPGSSADRLLDLIANAMLAVTIFSMTVMVSVYQSSSSQWTPRVHQLIMQDRITQKTLAAFIGTYLYALVAIILRELGVFVDDHALVLFWVTVLVLGFVVWSLVRWALHLQTFGSLLDTTRQVEVITKRQFEDRLDTPCLGANPLVGEVPEGAVCIRADESGYIRHLYPEALQATAKRFDVELFLSQPVGQFVFLNEPLLWVVGDLDEGATGEDDFETLVRDHINQGDLRSYDQDPRFGLTVMGEIGAKALSPGVNDPGTAIDVITRVGRILSSYRDETKGDGEAQFTRLWVPPLDADALLDDGFGTAMRDGASTFEVQHQLQRTLAGLMQHPDAGLSRAACDAACSALRRALAAIDFPGDRTRLLEAAHPDVRAAVD